MHFLPLLFVGLAFAAPTIEKKGMTSSNTLPALKIDPFKEPCDAEVSPLSTYRTLVVAIERVFGHATCGGPGSTYKQ